MSDTALKLNNHQRVIAASAIAAFASLAVACEDSATHLIPKLHFERITVGDTVVVRNIGLSSDSLRLTLTRERVLGDTAGSPGRDLVRVISLYPMMEGGAIVVESELRVRLFDSIGKFVRSFGSPGDGPGEFIAPTVVARDDSGHVFVQRLPRGVNVYDSLGKVVASWKAPVGNAWQWHVTPSGQVLMPGVVRQRDVSGKVAEQTQVMRWGLTGAVIDTGDARPLSFGPYLAVPHRYEDGGVYSYSIPMSPQFFSEFGTPGTWIYGNSSMYRIHVRDQAGNLMRIEGDTPPVALLPEERQALASAATAAMKTTDPKARLDPSQLPATKPFFKSLKRDADGRIWVELHQRAHMEKSLGCPPERSGGGWLESGAATFAATLCSDSMPPRPMDVVIEPTVYDVFHQNGVFAGRVAAPRRSTMLNARADFVWMQELDDNDVATIVRYRVRFLAQS